MFYQTNSDRKKWIPKCVGQIDGVPFEKDSSKLELGLKVGVKFGYLQYGGRGQ